MGEDMVTVVKNTLLIQQAISLFDLLPCRTTELQIAGDWLEDHGLHSFMANVVRNGKWNSVRGFYWKIGLDEKIYLYSYGNENGNEKGKGDGRGYGTGNGYGDGYGAGSGSGMGSGNGLGEGDYRLATGNIFGYGF